MLKSLEHFELIVHHAFVALDILLQNDLDGNLAGLSLRFSDDAICASSKGFAESIF